MSETPCQTPEPQTIKLVPVEWHNHTWEHDGTADFVVPDGWRFRDVKDFRGIDGNLYRALIVLEKCS